MLRSFADETTVTPATTLTTTTALPPPTTITTTAAAAEATTTATGCVDSVGGGLECRQIPGICRDVYAQVLCPAFCGFCSKYLEALAAV